MGVRLGHRAADIAALVYGIARGLSICMAWTLFDAPAATLADTLQPATLTTDIPAQPLADALKTFARQSGLQLLYVSSVVSNQQSRAVPAGLSAQEGLARLLEGTGLRFQFLAPRSVTLVRTTRGSATLEEVLVTATKREESLATVPMSASVLSPESIDGSAIKGIGGIAALTPGIQYDFSSEFGSGTLTNIALRGINSNSGQSTTALYLDEAPIHAWHIDTGFSNPYPVIFDLARVEILRGPQGTLFGTGAEGGAIRYITRQPSTSVFDALCRAEVSTTEHGDMSLEAGAAAGGPLIEGRLGARVTAWFRREGGYVDRVDPFTSATVDENANRQSMGLFRIALAFAPSDTVHITPSYAYQTLDIHDSSSFYTNLSDPGAGALRSGKLLRQPATDKFALTSLKVEADLGAAILTSATSYFDRTSLATVDQTNEAGVYVFGGYGNPLGPEYPSSYSDAVATLLYSHQFLFSQELRLATQDSAARLTWVVGVFYAHARADVTHDSYQVITPQVPGLYNVDYKVDTDLAAFGDATLRVARRWRLSLGARLGGTRTDFTDYAAGFANAGALPYFRNVADARPSLTPRFAVSYEPDAADLLYATAAQGFRAGGPNNPYCGVPATYAPDSVWSYELGAKDSLFGNRLRLATSVFYARWTSIQQRITTTNGCFVDYTINSGAAVSSGFDFSADALLGDRTYLSIAAGFLDVHYTRTIKAGGDVIVEQGTAVGALPAVPAPWSLAAAAEYRVPVHSGAVAYARAEEIVHSHNPGPFLERDPASSSFDPTQYSDPVTKLLNLHFGVMMRGLDLKVSVINVLNSQPVLQHDSDAPGATLQYAYTFRPRTVALSGTQRF